MVERPLTDLEFFVIKKEVGLGRAQFIVCAFAKGNPGIEYSDIDAIRYCSKKSQARRLSKELRKEFPKDEIRILLSKARRIE